MAAKFAHLHYHHRGTLCHYRDFSSACSSEVSLPPAAAVAAACQAVVLFVFMFFQSKR